MAGWPPPDPLGRRPPAAHRRRRPRRTRFPDAVARTGWPIELHDTPQGYVWETFGADHLHTVPSAHGVARGRESGRGRALHRRRRRGALERARDGGPAPRWATPPRTPSTWRAPTAACIRSTPERCASACATMSSGRIRPRPHRRATMVSWRSNVSSDTRPGDIVRRRTSSSMESVARQEVDKERPDDHGRRHDVQPRVEPAGRFLGEAEDIWRDIAAEYCRWSPSARCRLAAAAPPVSNAPGRAQSTAIDASAPPSASAVCLASASAENAGQCRSP